MRWPKVSLKLILPIFAVLITALIAAALIATKPKPVSKPVEEKEWQVRAIAAQLKNNVPLQPLLGKVVSPTLVTLSSALEADVQQVLVNEGQLVSKGETLLVLDDREAKQRQLQRQGELDEIEAAIAAEQVRFANDQSLLKEEETVLAVSEKAVERLRKLAQKDLSAQSQLDEAVQAQARQQVAVQNRRYLIDDHGARVDQLKAKQKQAKARLALAALDVERTRIVAPFNGRVTTRQVAVGQRVRNGEALFALYDVQRVEIIAQLPWSRYEQLAQMLHTGEKLRAQAYAEGRPVELVLNRVAAQVDASKGGVDVYFTVSDSRAALQIGRMLNLDLRLPEQPNSLVIPYEALYGLNKIYRIIDGRLQAVDVQVLGESAKVGDVRYVIVRGEKLTQGDSILATKFANAMEGLRVQVLP